MARKKIREYDSKRILMVQLQRLRGRKLNVRSLQVTEATDFAKLAAEHAWLSTTRLVAKPDMLFGQRGKHGLVLLDADLSGVEKFVRDWFARTLEINGQSGRVSHFVVEPFVPHKHEFYLSLQSNRLHDTLSFSEAGGVDIEANWDKLRTLELAQGDALAKHARFAEVVAAAALSERDVAELRAFVDDVYAVFEDLDFTMIEFNPFTIVDGDIVVLDVRGEVDSTAFFKNKLKWGPALEFPPPFGKKSLPEEQHVESLDAKTGASLKLTMLNPAGRIWLLVAGGGASVIFADTVGELGFSSELANYGEYSGAPNEEETYAYASTVLDLATRDAPNDGEHKVLIIGGGIANFTDIAKTFKGIVHALRKHKDALQKCRFKIFVRRAGPNYKPALTMMKEVGAEIGCEMEVYGPEVTMTHIVALATNGLQKKQASDK